jgi:hypothetical protein
VILANLIPSWKAIKKTFKDQKVVSVCIALGALIIQQRFGVSDRLNGAADH